MTTPDLAKPRTAVAVKGHVPPAVPANDQQLAARGIDPAAWRALKRVVFPSASDDAAMLAFDYCRARGLDVMTKPVHVVPTWSREHGGMIESIWEGIGSHRVKAARTGAYAGADEPEFGPMVTSKVGSVTVTYPEWCVFRVYRLVGGARMPFAAKIFWAETYSRGKDKQSPNDMWTRRPFGMLAKCAEAEALRKAFPEELGDIATEAETGVYGGDDAPDVPPQAKPLPEAKQAGNGADIGRRRDACAKRFADLGVSRAMLDRKIGYTDWTEEDIDGLRSLFTALRSGKTTVDDEFAAPDAVDSEVADDRPPADEDVDVFAE